MTDYKNCSQSDLESISVSVDRVKYPDRYQAVREEIQARKVAGAWIEQTDSKFAKIMNPSDETLRKWIPRYLVISSVVSIGVLIYAVAQAGFNSAPFLVLALGLAWTLTGLLAGFFYGRNPKRARLLAHIYLGPQVLNVMVSGYGFLALSGAGFGLRMIKNSEDTNFGFNFDLLNFYFQLNWNQPGVPTVLSINVVAMYVLVQLRKRLAP